MTRSVVVIGGGAAGIASAVGHLERGFDVTLVEARNELGGRARSFASVPLGVTIDNGTHVLLGCYHAFRRVLRAIGSEDAFWHAGALELCWLFEGGAVRRLRPPVLPAPLHLAAGLLAIDDLEVQDRLALLAAASAPFLGPRARQESVADWARRAGHNGWAHRLLFEPLCRAVMNAEAAQSDAALFLRTLREAFAGSRGHSAMWIPTRPWSQILGEPARSYLTRRGARVLLGHRMRAIAPGDNAPRLELEHRGTQVVLDGQDRVVLALPWRHAAALDPGGALARPAARLRASPIVNVHVALPEGAIPFADPIVALIDGAPFHFVCRTPDRDGRARADVPACLVAGAAAGLDGLPRRAIVRAALDQLARFLGRRVDWPARVHESAVVVREANATIAPRPGHGSARPQPGPTALRGLWLAGDWTDTGLPSTLEGAARSALAPLDAEAKARNR